MDGYFEWTIGYGCFIGLLVSRKIDLFTYYISPRYFIAGSLAGHQ